MLYSSFGVLCQRVEVWYIYAAVWLILFTIRMMGKDASLSKKEGWTAYKEKTWFIVPKLYNSLIASLVIYAIFGGLIYFAVSQGGIEKAAKSLYK